MTEILTDIEPFLGAVTAWVGNARSPASSTVLRTRLEELRLVFTNRLTDFDTAVRRPCGLFRSVPEHLSVDDSRIDEVFANLVFIRHGWESWLNGFHRFALNVSLVHQQPLEAALSRHEYDALVHERDLVEREGTEFTNRVIQEMREIRKRIELIRVERATIRDADEQIDSFERRLEVLKHDIDEHDPARAIKLRIVEYFEHLPTQMHHLETAANGVHNELENAVSAIDRIIPNLQTTDENTLTVVGDSFTLLAKLLLGRASF